MCFMAASARWKRSAAGRENGVVAWESQGTLPAALVFGGGRAYDDFNKGNIARP
jgi:hypothetical protein